MSHLLKAKKNIETQDFLEFKAKKDKYMGSFSVPGTDHGIRSEFVRKQLELMRTTIRSRPILVIVSAKGVKVTDKKGKALLMAHALHRISYCSCVPEDRLFCFLAREPKGPVNMQFCHAFTGSKQSQVEELNTILGNAFKAAHSAQRGPPATFNERIAEKLEEQRELYAEVQRRSDSDRARFVLDLSCD
ncbi:SH2 domain-containing protein 5-like [Watersipora subatra]|uniref:SH2 domain-containing protein 5-like n=1 Tax=Watersipora subatra TaxID=2589382 RepID=UPI00355AE108